MDPTDQLMFNLVNVSILTGHSVLFSRYLVLASSAMTAAPDHKAAASICFETIELEEDKYRLGHTKLFFRTGKVILEKINQSIAYSLIQA